LEAENAELRKRLGEDVTPIEQKPTAMLNLSLQEKVDLFRSLFKGREDVFARRWYSKTSGKAGYQPVCQNEWTPLCDKRTFKCADCPNRKFSPFTDNDIYLMKTTLVIFCVRILMTRTAKMDIKMMCWQSRLEDLAMPYLLKR